MVVPNAPETGKPSESAPKAAVAEDSASWLANLAGLGDAVASGRTCLPAGSRLPSWADPATRPALVWTLEAKGRCGSRSPPTLWSMDRAARPDALRPQGRYKQPTIAPTSGV